MKVLLKLLAIVVLFVGIWLILAQIDWVRHLQLEKAGDTVEAKLGDLVWEMISNDSNEITADSLMNAVDSIVIRICKANQIDRDKIKLHLLSESQVNAVTLPDRHLVIFSGLIRECKSEEELAGVIAHELGHMELNHVMKKLISEFGLSALISITTGGRGGEVAGEIIHVLSSSAYGRSLETEADLAAVEYLRRARINPSPFADFMYRLADEHDVPQQLTWIASHPDPKDRAEAIAKQILTDPVESKPILHPDTWAMLQGLDPGL